MVLPIDVLIWFQNCVHVGKQSKASIQIQCVSWKEGCNDIHSRVYSFQITTAANLSETRFMDVSYFVTVFILLY